MKLVAAAKLRRAQNAMSELKPYAGKYKEVLTSLINQALVRATMFTLYCRCVTLNDLQLLHFPRIEVCVVGLIRTLNVRFLIS